MSMIDAAGNLHAHDGRFAGHIQAEADPAKVLQAGTDGQVDLDQVEADVKLADTNSLLDYTARQMVRRLAETFDAQPQVGVFTQRGKTAVRLDAPNSDTNQTPGAATSVTLLFDRGGDGTATVVSGWVDDSGLTSGVSLTSRFADVNDPGPVRDRLDRLARMQVRFDDDNRRAVKEHFQSGRTFRSAEEFGDTLVRVAPARGRHAVFTIDLEAGRPSKANLSTDFGVVTVEGDQLRQVVFHLGWQRWLDATEGSRTPQPPAVEETERFLAGL